MPNDLEQYLIAKGFDLKNLDKVNKHKVTPLTQAISDNNEKIVTLLLEAGANPILRNAHDNTPLSLAQNKANILAILEPVIAQYTCHDLFYTVGALFIIKKIKYRVTNVHDNGACSFGVLEVQNIKTNETYIIKIKKRFGGLEINNYISLNRYIDLFKIENFYKDEHDKNDVIALVQKFVPGSMLSKALSIDNDPHKDQIITAAIQALCQLHKQGFIHNDALPDNCLWNESTMQAEFIDFESARMKNTMHDDDFQQGKYADLHRLIYGCMTNEGNIIPGLSNYTNNIADILEHIEDDMLELSFKIKLATAQTELQQLFFSQQAKILKDYINKNGFDIDNLDAPNQHNVTALTEAIASNRLVVVKTLLEQGASPTLENGHGNTPLFLAQDKPKILAVLNTYIATTKQLTLA